jgi:exopolysaccharide production protein ExoQ
MTTIALSLKNRSLAQEMARILSDSSLMGRILIAFIVAYGAAIWWLLFFDFNAPESGEGAEGSRVLNQIIWFVVFAASLGNWLVSRSHTPFWHFVPVLWPALAYLALALLSVSWALSPEAALRRFVLQAMFVASAFFALCVIEDRRRILQDLLLVFAATLVLNLVAIAIRPPTPLGHAGIYGQKNVLGLVVALAMLLAMAGLVARRFLIMAVSVFVLVAGAVLLVLSQSKTSLGLVVLVPFVSIGLVAGSGIFRVPLGVFFLFLLGVTGSAVVLGKQVFFISRETFLNVLVGDPTFTGRTVIWDFVDRHIDQRFWLGHGYNSYWGIGPESPPLREGYSFLTLIHQAHNGYIDIWLDLGLIGLVLVLLTAPVAVARLGSSPGWTRSDRAVILALILFALLHNLMESSLFRSTALVWTLYLVMLLMIGGGRHVPRPAPVMPTLQPPRMRKTA